MLGGGYFLSETRKEQLEQSCLEDWLGKNVVNGIDLVRDLTVSAMFPGTGVQEVTWVNSRVRRVCSTLQVTYPFSKLSTNLYSQQQCHI